jgi:hypothetical protein
LRWKYKYIGKSFRVAIPIKSTADWDNFIEFSTTCPVPGCKHRKRPTEAVCIGHNMYVGDTCLICGKPSDGNVFCQKCGNIRGDSYEVKTDLPQLAADVLTTVSKPCFRD